MNPARSHRNRLVGTTRRGRSPRQRTRVATLSLLVLGVWLMTTAFLWARGTGGGFDPAWNDFVVGAAIAVLSVLRVLLPRSSGLLAVAAVLLGLWLIAAPFMLDFTAATAGSAATWNSFAAGALIALLATSPVSAPLHGAPVR
jgi:hypothetical protein